MAARRSAQSKRPRRPPSRRKRPFSSRSRWRIAAFATALFIGGALLVATGIITNGVPLTAPPGFGPRLRRYLFANWAATSPSGSGLASCAGLNLEAANGHDVTSGAAMAGERFPELLQRGFPGLSPTTLFSVAEQTVRRLPGWRIVRSDRAAHSLTCGYTTRLFHFKDKIRIVVMPDSEIALCSQSGAYVGGLGRNIANIDEFYSALKPGIDRAYRQAAQRARSRFERSGWR